MLECNFLNKRICIVTKNVDGNMYVLKADDYNELINDWNGECNYVPSNDAPVYFAALDGRPINPFHYNNFESLILHIKKNWVFKD